MTLEAALLDLDADAAGMAPPPALPGHPGAAVPDAKADATAAAAPPVTTAAETPLRDAIDACQRQAITTALAHHQGNWAQAARALDVDASNLHKLARRLGIK
ncbi:Nitric oxide reductase transcription regulator NorR2 [compost metagenome]